MFRKTVTLILLLAAILVFTGCASMLDGEYTAVTKHQESSEMPGDNNSVRAISTYDELQRALSGFVSEHTRTGLLRFYDYDGELEDDLELACLEISRNTPLGAYAVDYMSSSLTRIVSYYEAEISINYKRAKSQIDDIVTAVSKEAFNIALYNTLKDFDSALVVSTDVITITEESIREFIEKSYYENPLDIVVIPTTTIEMFPDNADKRIVEITHNYEYSVRNLETMKTAFSDRIKEVAQEIEVVDTGTALLELCNAVCEITEYDGSSAGSIEYNRQNRLFTAYGVFVDELALGEGYAMAYKALCDLLDLECYVVIGRLNDVMHAWNIVELEGDYYHVDVSMCDENGIEAAFLKSDSDIRNEYWWDTENYNKCDGLLTYFDISERQ